MMQVTCQWCGHRYTMKREAVAYAVAAAQAANAKHHVENCPKCRKVMKIPVADMKRRLPPGTPLPEVTAGGELPPGSALTAEHGRAGDMENLPPGTPLPDPAAPDEKSDAG